MCFVYELLTLSDKQMGTADLHKKKLSVEFKFYLKLSTFYCLFVFLALQPFWLYFSQPGSGLYPPHFRGFLITHNDAPHSVGPL